MAGLLAGYRAPGSLTMTLAMQVHEKYDPIVEATSEEPDAALHEPWTPFAACRRYSAAAAPYSRPWPWPLPRPRPRRLLLHASTSAF